MGSSFGASGRDPSFVLETPEMYEKGGNVFISRGGHCRAVMPMYVFEQYIREGYQLIKDFHAREGVNVVPVSFKPALPKQ